MHSIQTPVARLLLGAVLVLGVGGCSGKQIADGKSDSASTGGNAGVETGGARSSGTAAGGGAGLAGSGGSSAGGSTSALPECVRPLNESQCAATYDTALASIQCGSPTGLLQYSAGTCGALRVFGTFEVDVAETCYYDSSGALISGSVCSKTTGNCNCFIYGSETAHSPPCKDLVLTDPCTEDAGAKD